MWTHALLGSTSCCEPGLSVLKLHQFGLAAGCIDKLMLEWQCLLQLSVQKLHQLSLAADCIFCAR